MDTVIITYKLLLFCRLKISFHSAVMDREVDHVKIKQLLTATIVSLCNNSLSYSGELSVQGLIGITIDHKDIILVNINETLGKASSTGLSQQCKPVVHTQAEHLHAGSLQPVATSTEQNYTSDRGIAAVRQKQAANSVSSTPASKNRVSKQLIINFWY